ncbi:kelch repeat-containing protein, partial [Planctomycetota bacterium]
IDTANVPVARAYHTALWTGSRMIIWGGKNASTKYKDGGVFDPTANEWKIGSYSNLNDGTHANNPAVRYEHLAVWTGPGTAESWNNKMIVWGGTGNGTSGLNSGAIYDMALDIWTTMGTDSAPTGRWRFSSVWTDAGSNSWNNKIIVWGGYNGTNPLADGATYDPSINSWTTMTATTNAPSARMYHSAVWTGTRMIIWGGDGIKQVGGVYNPATSEWNDTSITAAPSARLSHTGVWDSTNNFMIIWGGWDGTNQLYTGGTYTAQ